MRRVFLPLLLLLCTLPVALRALQETPALRLEITGVNASQLPTATITTNVYDALGQPARGLGIQNFRVTGELANVTQITSVENITDDNLPFATVLIIDISDSMTDAPIAAARDAARAFVNSVGDNDPVAIVTFGSRVRIVQDYTTDKTLLLNAIDSIRTGGRTALYQGAYEAIDLAASSPTPRRAAILLSDGVEYGGLSTATADEVNEQAVVRGVPVYTIGLGYGADRAFLQRLSERTNARFYETPSSDELVEIYRDLAALLRSQYVLTLSVDVPLDGTEYDLGIEVTHEQMTAAANAILRAPIPVPIVRLSELPAEPLEVPNTVTADVLADDPVTGVTFSAGDQTAVVSATPYTFTIDPVAYPPGDYVLSVEASDADGDTGTSEAAFSVAALPSDVTISPDLQTLGAIDEPVTVTLDVSGQTPATALAYTAVGSAFPDGAFVPVNADGTLTLDPQTLAPGDNQLTVQVTNESGITSTTAFPFQVASLPPVITIGGIQDGQIIDAPVILDVTASGQTPDVTIRVSVGDQTLEPDTTEQDGNTARSIFTIDPMQFAPGAQSILVSASTDESQWATQRVNVMVSSLPPTILVSGLEDGDVIAEDTRVDLDFVSQTPVAHVALLLDGQELAHQVSAPFGTTLSVLEIGPGEHTLRIAADTAGNQHSSLDIRFSVAEGPSLTATALAPTATHTPTDTADATRTYQATLSAARTTTAQAATAETAQANASGTAVHTTATAVALATTDAVMQATSRAASLATQNIESTATRRAIATQNANATATQIANSTATAEQAALATRNAQATQNAIATQNVLATQDAQATQNAVSTSVAQSTATEQFIATATFNARATSQSIAQQEAQQSTRSALATANVQARMNATATADMRSTRTAEAAATQEANATVTAQAQSTQAAAAEMTATQRTVQTQTAVVVATSTAQAQLTLTAEANEASTQAADATSTRAALATARFNETATAQQQATIDTQLAAIGATATLSNAETEEPTEGATAVAQAGETGTPRQTPSPQPTLTLIEAENPPSQNDSIPPLLLGLVVLILILAIVLILTSRRRRQTNR